MRERKREQARSKRGAREQGRSKRGREKEEKEEKKEEKCLLLLCLEPHDDDGDGGDHHGDHKHPGHHPVDHIQAMRLPGLCCRAARDVRVVLGRETGEGGDGAGKEKTEF